MVVPKRAPAAEVDINNFSGETANMWSKNNLPPDY